MKYLNDTHYKAIELLLEGKKNQEIAETLGVHRNSITNWTKDETFQSELRKAAVRHSQHRLGELITRMYEVAINEGSAAMAKLILQSQGMLTDKVSVDQTITKKEGIIDYDTIDEEIESFAKRLEDETDIEH